VGVACIPAVPLFISESSPVIHTSLLLCALQFLRSVGVTQVPEVADLDIKKFKR
jgi:hypothetical protein